MKTVADLFATTGAEFGQDPQSDRHFLLVTRLPADNPESGCTYVKSVTPGMLQNEYWVAREKNLLMLLKKLPQVARLRKDDDNGETGYHTVRTRDAGISLNFWMQMKPVLAKTGESLPHPFATVNAFLQLARAALTALKGIHKENIVHANIRPDNLCLPYTPFPYAFGEAILPDYANLTLIDFMFAVSNTLRLYRPLAIQPLAPPSYHSTQLRHTLETDHLNQRAELIQEIDYSVDLYALGHLLEEIFQKGLIYAPNMQSQMEMTIYNLIQELLGFDDGIPPGLLQKYGGTMPHDVYIKRIDNMLSMDPKASDPESYRLQLDPDQSMDDPVTAPLVQPQEYLEPHPPADDLPSTATQPVLPSEPLLVTASLPPTSSSSRSSPPKDRPTGFLEITAPVVIALITLLQGGAFIYQEGDHLHMDIALSLLLMFAIGGGAGLLALLLLPRDWLYSFIEPDPAELAEWEAHSNEWHAEQARLASLEPDRSVEFNKYAVISVLVSGQLAWLIYTEGDRVNLDIPVSLLLTLGIGIGLAAAIHWYEKFMTVKPIRSADEEEHAGSPAAISSPAVVDTDEVPVVAVAATVSAASDIASVQAPVETAPAPVNVFEQPDAEIPSTAPDASDMPEPLPTTGTGDSVFERREPEPVVVAPVVEPIPEPVASVPSPVISSAPTLETADLAKDGKDTYWEFDKKYVILLLLLFLGTIAYLTLRDHQPATPVAPAAPPAPPEPVAAQPAPEPVLPPVEDLPSVPESQPQVELPASAPKEAHMAAPKPRIARAKPTKAPAAAEAPAETEAAAAPAAAQPAPAVAEAPAEAAKPAPQPAAATPAATVEAKPVEAPPRPLGNPLAQAENVMGWYYFKGISVKKDIGEAIKHFRKAAELGDPSGQFNLGLMYATGNGIGPSQTEAAKWYKKSAEQGKASAQLNLGLMYLSGRGVPQNTAEGMRLLKLAADQGDATAQSTLDSLSKPAAPPTAP